MSDTYARRRARQMSDQELRLFQDAIVQEQATRRRLDASPEKIEHAIAEYQRSMGREDGDEWEQPVSALDSYPQGAVVTHDGERYRSTTAANVWQPPIGWRLVPETDDEGREIPPPYVPPTGSHDSYGEGEMITWVDGNIYRAARNGVVHSPDEYAPDWILVEPDSEPEPPEGEEGDDEDDEPVEPGEPDEDDSGEDEGDDADELELPEWVPDGHQYAAGDEFTHDGHVYRVVQAHTSQPGWMPDMVPALYERQ